MSREPGEYLESPTQQPVRLTEFRQALTGWNERQERKLEKFMEVEFPRMRINTAHTLTFRHNGILVNCGEKYGIEQER